MIAPSRCFTPAEASVLAGVAVKAVHNAIDKGIIGTTSPGTAKRAPRAVSAEGVLRLKLWNEVGAILSNEGQLRLFDEIARRPTAKRVRADALVIVDIAEARKQIAERARDLDAAEAVITCNSAVMSGEPVFKGTRIPVHLVASMLDNGATEAELLDGYPTLAQRHLRLARIWAAAHPRRGRLRTLAKYGVSMRSQSRMALGPDPGPAKSEQRQAR